MPSETLTWEEVRALRLALHRLLTPATSSELVRVAGEVCGIHAQIMASAELSLGLRVAGITRQDVRSELWERRRLVKTHGIRGTVHLFPAAELGHWLAALASVQQPLSMAVAEAWGLEPRQIPALVEAIGAALDGRRLTRQELGEEVARRVGRWALEGGYAAFGRGAPKWTAAIGAAAAAGALCFGPNEGSTVTFVRPDQWIDSWHSPDRREALEWAFRRFLAAYGPATPDEFALWFYMESRDARELAAAMRPQLREVRVGERTALLPNDLDLAGTVLEPSARLLPRFDCYLVGSRPRDQLILSEVRERFDARLPRRLGTIAPYQVLLLDGMVGGVWEHRRVRGRMDIRVDAYLRLSDRHQELLEAEAVRIGDILEAVPTLQFGSVDPTAHL